MFSSHLQVNKEYNANLWFWYFPVSDKPVEDTPLILWLQGGPGASSLYGLFTEIGPFIVTEDRNLEGTQFFFIFSVPFFVGYLYTNRSNSFERMADFLCPDAGIDPMTPD